MKAPMKLMGAASAFALSAGLVVSGSLAVQFAAVSVAQAAVVSSITVRGNQRVDAETIRNYLTIRPGESFAGGDIDESLKRLFGTGLFSDVRINQSGGTLVVEVDEYPVVNQVLFQGNRKLKDADIARAVQLKPRGSFSQAQLDADAEAVREAYSRIGRDDATVTTQIMDLGENRVNVVFEIDEGGRTKIETISFVGNNAFGDRRLADVISTKRSGMLSFLFRNDVYDEDRLRADEETLRRFYYNRGYADFQVISSSAELDESSNEYTITFTVDEGERYTFGDVTIESSIEGIEPTSLNSEVETRGGDVYSAEEVEDTIIGLTERLAGEGYAFAQVTPRGDRNFETRTISVVYTIDQGPRTYIERIEIRGNNRTRDYVIRREFDVSEGDAFNQVLIQRAKRRLEDLDYFQSVNIATAPGSQPDQVILVVDLIEKSTGEFSIGAGYSTGSQTGGVMVEGSISERNFLGRGQFIRISAGGGKNARDFSLSFTEPYFLGRRISAGFDVYRQSRIFDNYETDLTGATVRMGLPITNNLTTVLAYNYTQENYSLADRCDSDGDAIPNEPADNDGIPSGGCSVSSPILSGIATSPWRKSSVSAGLNYNTIDDMKNPHDGIFANVTVEYAGLGGDANWAKFTGRAHYYRTLSEAQDIVGLISVGGGHIEAIDPLRVFDQFQSSDKIIRGFAYNGIGPADIGPDGIPGTGDDYRLGGTTYLHATAEAQFPLPAVPPSLGLRGAFFADAATLFGVDSGVSDRTGFVVPGAQRASFGMEWRASVGASLIWASPFGPIRVDYAIPVLKEKSDVVQNFNFGISTRF